jgi:hypothetical protein
MRHTRRRKPHHQSLPGLVLFRRCCPELWPSGMIRRSYILEETISVFLMCRMVHLRSFPVQECSLDAKELHRVHIV